MESKKLSRELPTWFNLNNYEGAKDFGVLEWSLNLEVRRDLLSEKPWTRDDEWWAEITQNGLISRSICNEYFEGDDDISEDYGGGGRLVYGLSMHRAHEIYEWIKWDTELQFNLEVIKYQNILASARTVPLDDFESYLSKWHKMEFLRGKYDEKYGDYGGSSPHVCIDLEAPDDVIVDAFKTWLAAERKKNGERKLHIKARKFSRWNFPKWCEYSVLPYLDLQIYQKKTMKTLPVNVIGNAIFSLDVDFDTTEAVRKTTRPYVDAALGSIFDLEAHREYEVFKRKMEKTAP